MQTTRIAPLGSLVLAAVVLAVCGGSTTSPTSTTNTSTGSTGAASTGTTPTTTPATAPAASSSTLPAIYAKFASTVQVSLSGDTVVIQATDLPNHPSPYWGVGNANYEAPQTGMSVNPNLIATQNLTFRVPADPSTATSSDTPLGPMGVATNGVALFNQYAAGRVPLTNEILSFDRYNGHPSPSNQYHYHFEPVWLTSASKSALVGVLLDGYPVYGPQDGDGTTPGDLDSCNGHTRATSDVPSGIYHYHTTTAVPYIAGCFRGKPGTVTGG